MDHVVLSGPPAVHAGKPFPVDVTVHTSGPRTVIAVLRQSQPPGPGTWTTPVAVGATGIGYGKFDDVVASDRPTTTFLGNVPKDPGIAADTLTVAVTVAPAEG